MLRCVLFDLDGTLLKLDIDWAAKVREFSELYFAGKYKGWSPRDFFVGRYKYLEKKLSAGARAEMRARRLEFEIKGLPAKGLNTSKVKLMGRLSKKYKLGVVSGNLRETVAEALKRCGILKYIRVIVSMDDVSRSKPSPEPLLLAMEKLKCKPEESVYIGDHPEDILAGKRAGMKTIGVLSNRLRKEMAAAKPNAIIESFSSLENVLAKL